MKKTRQLFKQVNAAKKIFVREFVAECKARHRRGEALVSVREVMKALGSSPADVESCWTELREAGMQFHHTDLQDRTLPTVGGASYIGCAYKAK